MVTFISKSPEATRELGERWGREAKLGWVIGLTGDLGAGKTVLVKGIAAGLGITERVHSPTFTLVNEYSGGRWPLYHLDLYRLETARQIFDAGLEEYLINPNGVAVAEWFDRWFNSPSPAQTRDIQKLACRCVQIEVLGETERRIQYEDIGA